MSQLARDKHQGGATCEITRANGNTGHLLSGALLVFYRLTELGISLHARIMKEQGEGLGVEAYDCEDGKIKTNDNWPPIAGQRKAVRLRKTNIVCA